MSVTTVPPIFARWGAISAIASALERKAWITAYGGLPLYPNMYITLIGPPAVGKTQTITPIQDLIRGLTSHFVAPTNVSRASLIDALADSRRPVIGPQGQHNDFHALFAGVGELGNFMPSYDNEFMNTLISLWDGTPYSEKKRTTKLEINIERPVLNILAGTTVDYLHRFVPEGGWDQGFLSRVILVYKGEKTVQPLFSPIAPRVRMHDDLQHDLRLIGEAWGEMRFEPDAAVAMNNWHMSHGAPAPEHPRLLHYNARRTTHMLKLCMVASFTTGLDRIITLAHFNMALEWITEAESFMPDIFKTMTSGGDGKVIEDTWFFCFTLYAKEKKPIAEQRIISFLSQKVPAHNVLRILEMMIRSGYLIGEVVQGISCYKPAAKKMGA